MRQDMVRSSRLPIEDVVSAGGIVYRKTPRGVEVAICGLTAEEIWGLPKGTPNPGETLEQTAVREVTEETGLQVVIQKKIGSINYWFTRPQEGKRYHKTVYYYLMTPIGGDLTYHDREFDRVEWFPVEEACALLTYANEVEMVRRAMALIATDPAPNSANGGLSHDSSGE